MSEAIEEKRDYPRTPKKVTAHKLKTRETAKLLEGAGFEIIHSSYGMKNLFYLVKEQPELLSRVVDAMLSADDETHKLWNFIIGNEMAHHFQLSRTRNHQTVYEKWLVLAPIAMQLFAEEASKGDSVFHRVGWVERDVREAYDKKAPTTDARLHTARVIVFHFVKVTRRAMTEEARVEAADYLARNLDVVAPLLPELFQRKTLDPGTIEALREVASPALMEGVL